MMLAGTVSVHEIGVFAGAHPVPALLLAVVALTGLILAVRAVRALLRALTRAVAAGVGSVGRVVATTDRADLLTYVAASIATGVAAQGMWNFFRDVLTLPAELRVGMFAFIELAVVTSAVRARRNMREHGSAGVDGAAVWALTGLSAVFSSMDANSVPEAMFRLAAPLVAAWLWERGMAVERRRLTHTSRIHWRLTPERVLVRLGLAEPSGRTAGQVDVERRLTRLALAAKLARDLQTATGRLSRWRQRRAMSRLDTAMRQAVTHTALAGDQSQQQHLLTQLAALTNASTLLTLTHPAPWYTTQDTDSSTDQNNSSSDRPARRRSTRAGGGSGPGSVAVKVARLRERHPDWTLGQIGQRAGVSERTVRRYLNTPPTTGIAGTGPGTDDVAA